MALLEQWQKVAYNEKANKQDLQRFWQRYFLLEKNVYEQLLTNPDEVVENETVKEKAIKLELKVAPSDTGKVIGKQGRIAKSIRAVVKAAATREDKKVIVDIM